MTKADSYAISRTTLQSARLAGAKVFSQIDLVRGYHKKSVAEKVSKTTVITPFNLFHVSTHAF